MVVHSAQDSQVDIRTMQVELIVAEVHITVEVEVNIMAEIHIMEEIRIMDLTTEIFTDKIWNPM